MLLHYDISKMQALLKSFYTLTGIRIVVFDDNFQKVVEHPGYDSAFCSLIRKNPAAMEKCRMSDRYACQKCKATGSLYSYTCHAGLTETVAPIRYGNMVIGYLMIGQVLCCDDKEKYWPAVWQRCQHYGAGQLGLKAKYDRKAPVNLEQVYAAAQILEACAGYLWLQRTVSLQEDDLPRQIDDYITENLSADLSADALCSRFGISRSKLYKIAREYYSKGIVRLIRELRVERAKELLQDTGLTVSDVAAQVGYADYNYFIKVFKKAIGVTPKQFGLGIRYTK